jgi:hypothetical protein
MGALFAVLKAVGLLIGALAIVVAPFVWIERLLDRRAQRVLRAYCDLKGLAVIKISVHKSHYGLTFGLNEQRHYVRCLVHKGQVEFLKPVPEVLQRQ